MSLLKKIAAVAVYALIAVWVSGAVGNATHNPGNATGAFIAFVTGGLILASLLFRRRSVSAA